MTPNKQIKEPLMTTTASKWTIETYAIHNEALRSVEEKFQTERDRRYTEVNVEKEKALKIKETADLTALELARESQVYKDERNDAMREQSLKETGIYATHSDIADVLKKMETSLKPLLEFVNAQQGQDHGSDITMGKVYSAIAAGVGIAGVVFLVINFLFK